MKRHLLRIATVAALATGIALAQAPDAGGQAASARAPQGLRTAVHRRLLQALNLTDAQKAQAKSIFQQAWQTAQPLAQQAKQNREALAEAVKANDTAQIRQLATTQGNLQGQLLGVRSEAMAGFYNILTPEQRAKADQIRQKVKQRIQQRVSRRSNC